MEPAINKKDIPAFGGAGIVIASLNALFDEYELPENMDRDFLSSLLFDHIPFNSISILILSMFVVLFSSVAFKKMKGPSLVLLGHLSDRVSQLSSPAFCIVVGNMLVVFILAVWKENHTYYGHVIVYALFAAIVLAISIVSNQIIHGYDKVHRGIPSGLAIAGLLSLLIAPLAQSYFDQRPKIVEVKFTVEDYEQLEKLAKQKEMTLNQVIRDLISQKGKSNDNNALNSM